MTPAGNFLVAHMDLGKVVEYGPDGKEIWSVAAPSARAAVRLKKGNTLISGNQHGYVGEVNPAGATVWENQQRRSATDWPTASNRVEDAGPSVVQSRSAQTTFLSRVSKRIYVCRFHPSTGELTSLEAA
jgi:hypothetical protein